ncbi:siderophore ABC transporter substrate-binding protein [Natribacillus halophilus]|uniref:Iron complex transport system substrate-binding protein n=1 Tax=Natribacillus halophilus TaxID=549003 RepID=A0A1G8QNS0_9BACI|nr:siderophore ABC transporter substrate-binding protein [Natribacillus halophilus]SDJ06328.1 iron complex transport system substrate-binding protein [Natribacillus halophilus]
MQKHFLGILTGLSMTALAACGGGDTDEASGDENNSSESNEEITVEHELGETTVPVDPDSVVSFDFGVTDSVRALDGNISGIPKADNVPDYLSEFESDEYEDIGSLFEPNFELINEMQPEIIFISDRTSEHYEELSEIAPTVFLGRDEENYMETFEENMQTLGEIFDAEDEVNSHLNDIQALIDDVHERASESEETGLILQADEGDASAYGPGSRFGIIHDELGVTPADADIDAANHGQNVSFEYISETDPDYLFVMDRGATIGEEASLDFVTGNELVERTSALQNDNVIQLDGDYWYLSDGGLESVKEMIAQIDEGFEES